MRFGILVPQDAPFPTLIERWQRAEELGFDQLWVADHSGDYRNLDGTWFDGWTVLAVMAEKTSRIRIGTLVSNPILRPSALLAKEALTIDHLSGGRLELGIGTGIAPFDHAAMGIDEIFEITRWQNDRLDELCVAFGRDPGKLRRSLLLFGALDAWRSPDAVEKVVKRFRKVGIGEFVVFWPPEVRLDLFEHVARDVLPVLRQG